MIALLLALLQAASAPASGKATFERVKTSVFTVEVHTGNAQAKSALGSGYLVSGTGHVVTNYHVVASYVEEPARNRIRVRNETGAFEARLLRFDLLNDLALLQVDGLPRRQPLRLAEREPSSGERIVSLGNPEGLGMSLIEGVFNGRAAKGVVDRFLLSMPLNSGMSGGPILDERGAVAGTNVAVIWLANSLSFGVPTTSLRPLLDGKDLAIEPGALRTEVNRQLDLVDKRTTERAIEPFTKETTGTWVKVGGAEVPRPPELFDCWDQQTERKDKGFRESVFQCNLQFTPSVEGAGEVGSVQIKVQYDESDHHSFGFYSLVRGQAETDHEPRAAPPENGVFSTPHCSTDRVAAGAFTWHVNTCLNGHVRHPGLLSFDASAFTVSEPRRSVIVTVHVSGLRLPGALSLLRSLLEGVREAKPS
jgi:serine protease Do